MSSLVVFTTQKDASRELFLTPKIQASCVVQIFFYEHFLHGEDLPLFNSEALLYLRDPFTSDIPDIDLRPLLTRILAHYTGNTFIDNLATLEDIYLEDKWLQYDKFKAYMPLTHRADASENFSVPAIYKKRISSRSRHILFNPPKDHTVDYITQECLPIKVEYRVIETKKEVLPIMLVKSSKTVSSKVKAVAHAAVTPEIHSFIKSIQSGHNFDLVGYDIALTEENKLFLIEVNRSPQIKAYQRETGINLFEKLLS